MLFKIITSRIQNGLNEQLDYTIGLGSMDGTTNVEDSGGQHALKVSSKIP